MQYLVLPLVQPRTNTDPGWTLPAPPVSAVLWLVACTAWWLQRRELLPLLLLLLLPLPPVLLLRAGACACPADRDRAAPCSTLPQQELEHTPSPARCCVLAERGCGCACSPPAAGHAANPPSWQVMSAQRCSRQQPACETNLGVKTFLSGTKTETCLRMCQGGTCMSTRGGHCLHQGGTAEGCSMGKLNTHRGQTCRAGFVN